MAVMDQRRARRGVYLISIHTTLGRYIYAISAAARKATGFAGLNVGQDQDLGLHTGGRTRRSRPDRSLTARGSDAVDPKAGLGYGGLIAARRHRRNFFERRARLDPRHGARLPHHRRP